VSDQQNQTSDTTESSQSSLADISKMPEFKSLTQKRGRMIFVLTIISLLVLLGNLLLMSTLSHQAGQQLYEGSSISIAIAYSVFVVFFGACICSFYVFWANRKIDDLIKTIHDKASQ